MNNQPAPIFLSRRFFPYFVTQFLGAFNDNIYKNALLLFVAFASVDDLPMSSTLFINLAAGLFILPFFLFSASAGVLTDQCEKSTLIRMVKLAEVVIMLLGAISFLTQSYIALLFLLFLMGAQSAFFGPVKYALLPQHLKPQELLKGNAWVETGTFLAILFGTIGAGFIVAAPSAYSITAMAVVSFALLGLLSSLFIPKAEAKIAAVKFEWKPVQHTKQTLLLVKQHKTIYAAIIAISWFWFLGASYLTQFPNFTKHYLNGDSTSVSFLLALFSVGIAVGSLLCAKLSHQKINFKLMLLGGFGITVCSLVLGLATPKPSESLITISTLFTSSQLYPVFIALLCLGICGGLFIVPLYTLMQTLASDQTRAQVIAANNIFNALFMVGSAVMGIVCLSIINISITDFFIVLGLLNLAMIAFLKKFFQSPVTLSSP
ncbi:MFS transporter [Vibrio sp. CK2-1]|uniref:MFS transporter n=1 Tax=Vibrio sp. CK2-1 TaxID=2912249 RepID=UPI001F018718|nr:MFS transporter [Vibrio sp. CK2-1]MCF7354476.1 MFS transporter [Vibrio sp. CK2-1]